MATNKTFKIGEYAKGGNIKVQINGQLIQIQFLDSRSNEQVGSKGTCLADEKNAYRKIMKFLEDGTSHYYAEKVADFIVEKSDVVKKFFWE